jgi:hypothetical protein
MGAHLVENIKDAAIVVAWSAGTIALVRFGYSFVVGGIEANIAEDRHRHDQDIDQADRTLSPGFQNPSPKATSG